MTWLYLTVVSACLLGCYDFLKKAALRDNAVLPVIFGGIIAGALIWLPFIIWSAVSPQTLPHPSLDVTGITLINHLQLLFKSLLVVVSWIFGYLGLKSLPLSIATPIRATSPLWTITFALILFMERPSPQQWLGMGVILMSFFAFSIAGKREGIVFHRSKAVLFIMIATFLGSSSSLFDKYLLQNQGLTANEVQAWFSLYSAPVMMPALLWWKTRPERHPFSFRWSVPAIGLVLIVADCLYFNAVAHPEALISVIAPVRRAAVIVSFALGILLLKEQFRIGKVCAVIGIVAGVLLLS